MNTLDVELKIKELVEHGERYVFTTSKEQKDFEWSVDNIINEIQLYRGLGTVEDFKELKENHTERQTDEDKMIRAAKKTTVTKDDLLDVFWRNGLTGVYNLGLKNMLDYLNGK
jgi:hypothetical protein